MALLNDKDKKISRQEKQTIKSGVRSRVKDLNTLEEGPGKVFRKIKNYAMGAKSSRKLINNANEELNTPKPTMSKPSMSKKGGPVKATKYKMGGSKMKKGKC
jgi:hypothetical protein